ncbi:MAG TPA: hypothetical protein VJJ82_00620 [Candidatus Nanoarchaeia archaeon]|nr:hypothetical protein [Candidatus Nanoarchaeia archaeon]
MSSTPTEKDIYRILNEWIAAAERGENCKAYRDDFGVLERTIFGKPAERVTNPVAMKYDLTRNAIVRYSGSKDPEDLAQARELFAQITSP